MSLADRVLATVRKHRMIPDGGRVIVALSGGPDSVALTLLLRGLQERGRFVVAGLAHVNHGLRERAADDEAFCRTFAEQIGLPLFTAHVDVRDAARRQGRSLEDAGRRARYRFFLQVRAAQAVDVVATGHSCDDQAETFLLRLLRGASARGLAGIYPVAGWVVRPLIDVRRREIHDYLEERNQAFCEDETNLDVAIPRNRVRHELIPLLEERFLPAVVEVLAREAESARRDEEHLQKEAIESSSLIVLRTRGRGAVPVTLEAIEPDRGPGCDEEAPPIAAADVVAVEIDAAALARLSQATGSRVVRLALSILAPDRFVGFDHVEAVLALASAEGGSVSLPGQQASRRGDRIEFVREIVRGFANSFCHPLSIPGEVVLDSQGWTVSAEVGVGAAGSATRKSNPLTAAVRADRIVLPLTVRSRRRGDRFQPPGLGGRHRKLQDYLVDRKVPRESRDSLPLVVDGEGRIVWITGHAVAEDFRVTEPSQGVIFLKARQLGGPG